MNLSTAVAVFKQLEEVRDTEYEGDPPVYDVRLDASTGRDDPPLMSAADPPMVRYFRVRVTPAKGMVATRDHWLYVLEVAGEHGCECDVDNNGIAITANWQS